MDNRKVKQLERKIREGFRPPENTKMVEEEINKCAAMSPEIKKEKITRLSYHFHFSNGSDMHFNVEE